MAIKGRFELELASSCLPWHLAILPTHPKPSTNLTHSPILDAEKKTSLEKFLSLFNFVFNQECEDWKNKCAPCSESGEAIKTELIIF